jgi:DNA repair exonuclease SbcCD ATPase subunit
LERRQRDYDDWLVDAVRAEVRKREWRWALRRILVLLLYYPRGFPLLLSQWRVERRRLARLLHVRKQELEDYEMRLKELEALVQEGSESASLAEERQKAHYQIQQLRGHTGGLKKKIQGLDQRAQLDLRAQEERRRLVRRLQALRQEIKDYEWWLKKLEGSREDVESALAKEHQRISQKAQELAHRIGEVEHHILIMDRHAHNGPRGRIRKLPKRVVDRLRAKVLKK